MNYMKKYMILYGMQSKYVIRIIILLFVHIVILINSLNLSSSDPFSILVGIVRQVEHDEELYFRVVETLKDLLIIVCKDFGELVHLTLLKSLLIY